jgi:hypothetical protein
MSLGMRAEGIKKPEGGKVVVESSKVQQQTLDVLGVK